MKLIQGLVIAALTGLFGGCASLPDAKVDYYLAQSNVKFNVIRTVTCDKNNNVIFANSVTPIVTHTADRSQLFEVDLTGLKGTFFDTDVKFEFYEDGRLKSVNAASTGQGETILKAVTTIAGAILAFDGTQKTYPAECAKIKDAVGDKPITLTYEGEINLNSRNVKQNIQPDISSKDFAISLASAIGNVSATVIAVELSNKPLTQTKTSKVVIKARQPGLVKIQVTADKEDGTTMGQLWEGKLPAAQFGTIYELPIQEPAKFGKEVFAATFSESGALNSVQYTSNTGAGQALNVVNSAITSLQGETTAQKASDVKAEADLIAQQQRLIQCQADPKTCK